MAIVKELSILTLCYLLAFGVSTVVIVYILNIPGIITGKQKLVDEYYKTNFLIYIPLDVVLVALYLLVAQLFIYISGIKNMLFRFLIVALTTTMISGFFYNMYMSSPVNKDSFFSRWFYGAGLYAILYDIVYVTIVYAVMVYILVEQVYKVNKK
jgi:hypothetical protein